MKTNLIAVGSMLGFVALVACSHESPPPSSTMTTSGREAAKPVSQADADKIAETMCAREAGCNNIGPGHKYATRDVCMMQNRADNMNELTNAHCPYGIDRGALDKCLADIRGDKCDNVLDHFTRLNACATASLCPR